ncbi:methyltransferase FkbM family [Parafrankia sp. EUN1f]|nr:methyltransferase FkbM family [Parafrankia sp. EUN1f]
MRWRVATQLAAWLPEMRGRDRLTSLVRGPSAQYTGPLSGRLSNGMTFSVDQCRDGSISSLVSLCYRPPALAPVFSAILEPGDCCYDVGANIGVYTLWAAGLVGDFGEVHAFEPVDGTRATLTALVEQNQLQNVRISSSAVGASEGEIGMKIHRNASGLAHPVTDGSQPDVSVPLTTLNTYAATRRPPVLVKIDVEGFELDVLRGASDILSTEHPALLLELLPAHLERRGMTAADIVDNLAGLGYRILNLSRHGLSGQGGFSSNVLALTPKWERFDRVVAELKRIRFPRNQTT